MTGGRVVTGPFVMEQRVAKTVRFSVEAYQQLALVNATDDAASRELVPPLAAKSGSHSVDQSEDYLDELCAIRSAWNLSFELFMDYADESDDGASESHGATLSSSSSSGTLSTSCCSGTLCDPVCHRDPSPTSPTSWTMWPTLTSDEPLGMESYAAPLPFDVSSGRPICHHREEHESRTPRSSIGATVPIGTPGFFIPARLDDTLRELSQLYAEFGTTELIEEGPVAYVATWFLRSDNRRSSTEMRVVRLHGDPLHWHQLLAEAWADLFDVWDTWDWFLVHGRPPRDMLDGVIADLVITQRQQPVEECALSFTTWYTRAGALLTPLPMIHALLVPLPCWIQDVAEVLDVDLDLDGRTCEVSSGGDIS